MRVGKENVVILFCELTFEHQNRDCLESGGNYFNSISL